MKLETRKFLVLCILFLLVGIIIVLFSMTVYFTIFKGRIVSPKQVIETRYEGVKSTRRNMGTIDM